MPVEVTDAGFEREPGNEVFELGAGRAVESGRVVRTAADAYPGEPGVGAAQELDEEGPDVGFLVPVAAYADDGVVTVSVSLCVARPIRRPAGRRTRWIVRAPSAPRTARRSRPEAARMPTSAVHPSVIGDPKSRADKREITLPGFVLLDVRRHLEWSAPASPRRRLHGADGTDGARVAAAHQNLLRFVLRVAWRSERDDADLAAA
ncbi:hypothetical protein [Streptomyces sp. NPDC007088]|uniref:hypothetical protein n=1 Tax=Streptomyces sp. NPDC007088 TaxID=3364773 RepID=UPI00369F6CDB